MFSHTVWQRNQRRDKKRAAVIAAGGKCIDCGFDDLDRIEVFTFDHRPEHEKCFQISLYFARVSQARMDEEIAKCDLVCANCHATRTARRLREQITIRSADG